MRTSLLEYSFEWVPGNVEWSSCTHGEDWSRAGRHVGYLTSSKKLLSWIHCAEVHFLLSSTELHPLRWYRHDQQYPDVRLHPSRRSSLSRILDADDIQPLDDVIPVVQSAKDYCSQAWGMDSYHSPSHYHTQGYTELPWIHLRPYDAVEDVRDGWSFWAYGENNMFWVYFLLENYQFRI